jgi:hypothetical protein
MYLPQLQRPSFAPIQQGITKAMKSTFDLLFIITECVKFLKG